MAHSACGVAALIAIACTSVRGQDPAAELPVPTPVAGLQRVAGKDVKSQIEFVQVILSGTTHPAPPRDARTVAAPEVQISPTLIGQCSLRPSGRHVFEVFANFGDATPLDFYPPWVPTSADDKFPPSTEKATITMEFLGYTHVKPVRRQWEMPVQNTTQYRYNPPGVSSPNLEEMAYYLRYLLALPTLRLTLGPRSAEFMTTPWLNALRAEPVCAAASL